MEDARSAEGAGARATSAYRFGEFLLEPGKRRLTGRDGPVALSARAYDVLVHLVLNRERIVGKDELLKAVWPQSVVEDNNLNQAITSVRRALGDSRDAPRFVATIAGRGYQFVGDVERAPAGEPVGMSPGASESGSSRQAAVSLAGDESGLVQTSNANESPAPLPGATATSEPAVPPASGREASAAPAQPLEPSRPAAGPRSLPRRAMLVGVGAAAVAAASATMWWKLGRGGSHGPRSIAVLPFRPLISEARNPALELGVTEQLINRLSRIPGIVVTPLSSVLAFAAGQVDPMEAGRRLGVDAIVDGHVQVQDPHVRLTARLVAVEDGTALWANSFTERLGELLAVQDSLAMQIAAAMSVELSTDARSRVFARETTDVEAWQLYANGRFQADRRNAAGLERAIEYFEAALGRDPRFARAAAWLADAHTLTVVFGIASPGRAFERARQVAERALELDPALPDAHMAMGHVLVQGERKFGAARDSQLRALQLDPGFARARTHLALTLCQIGDLDGAIDEMRKALAREPGSLPNAAVLGWILYQSRRFDEAERHLGRIVETSPDAGLARHFLARVLLVHKRGAEAVRLLGDTPSPAPTAFSNLGRAYAQAGNAGAARAEIARLESLGARGFGVAFDLALIHLDLGERDRALAALERGIDDLSQQQGYVSVDPALDPLRGEARFQAVVRRLGLA